jgi:hypothetical protein
MAVASNLTDRYLRALALMQERQAHDARGSLYSLTLHAGLISEALQHADLTDPQTLAKLKGHAENARKAIAEVKEALDALLTQTDLRPRSGVDLGKMLHEVGALLAPWLENRQLGWRLTVPELPVPLEIDRVALWQAIVVAAVEGTETMNPQETLEITLDRSGRWTLTGPRPNVWLDPLRQAIEAIGGEVLASASHVDVRIPTGVRR